MRDNKKRSGIYLGKGIRFKQEFLDIPEYYPASGPTVISPLLMNLSSINGFTGNEDDYDLPGLFYREMLSEEDKANLVGNIVCSLKGIKSPQKEKIINDQLYHYFKIDTKFGLAVADGMEIKVGTFLLSR